MLIGRESGGEFSPPPATRMLATFWILAASLGGLWLRGFREATTFAFRLLRDNAEVEDFVFQHFFGHFPFL